MSTDAQAWPDGYDLITLDEVDSTNAEAARIAADLTRPTWITAKSQTAARGRQGRDWQNPTGNLAATLVIKPEGSVAQAALRSFLAANAVLETLAVSVDRAKLSLKWPNDVLLDGGKVAGILLESAGSRDGVEWLAIGIGINLLSAPQDVLDARFPPVSVCEACDKELDRDSVLTILAVAFAAQEQLFAAQGFGAIRDRWLTHAARLGEEITARLPREEITGIFETIDDSGNLILRRPTGPVAVAAADVYF